MAGFACPWQVKRIIRVKNVFIQGGSTELRYFLFWKLLARATGLTATCVDYSSSSANCFSTHFSSSLFSSWYVASFLVCCSFLVFFHRAVSRTSFVSPPPLSLSLFYSLSIIWDSVQIQPAKKGVPANNSQGHEART